MILLVASSQIAAVRRLPQGLFAGRFGV